MDENPAPAVRLPARETFTKAPPVEEDRGAVLHAPIRAHFPGEAPPEGLRLTDLGPAGEAEPTVRQALLGDPFDDPFVSGAVRCNACAHRCVIRPGRIGICGVRQNRGGRLYTLVYGDVVAGKAEPIEKKPLYHFLPGSTAYSIATRGCNFHCAFCQNWEMAQGHRQGLVPRSRYLPPEEAVDEAVAAGVRSIAYTYVEPTVFIEYALETMIRARAAGLHNVFVSNGYQTPEAIELVAPYLDAINVDLKAGRDSTYRRVCGARLDPVREAIVELYRRGVWLEITTLVIPGVNDGLDELTSIAEWIGAAVGPETPWHVSRFEPAHLMRAVPPTPAATLAAAAAIAREVGLRHVYVGNAPEIGQEDTRCARCGRTLIERAEFSVVGWHMREGRCPRCGHGVAGVAMEAAPVRPTPVAGEASGVAPGRRTWPVPRDGAGGHGKW